MRGSPSSGGVAWVFGGFDHQHNAAAKKEYGGDIDED